jgi:thiosulfate/3-mercaptopyruvate sulfurtransferase
MRLVLRAFCATLVAAASACSDPVAAPAPAAPDVPGVVVEASWAAPRLAAGDVIVVDAREPADYDAGHVAGAVSLPTSSTLSRDPSRPKELASLVEIQRAIGGAGVRADRPVVVYDAGDDYRPAARLFWILEVHGHPAAAVLDGGFAAWKSSGRPVETAATRLPPSGYVAVMNRRCLETKLGVRLALHDDATTILDARSVEEYVGAKSETPRAGRIPGALNLDFKRNLAGDGRACVVRSIDELRPLYADLDHERRVIAYCNSGNRAAVAYLALRAQGFDAAVYAGSFLEWSSDDTLPVETGPPSMGAAR